MTQGFKPVCVYSPKYPVATSKMPSARWVMPNECAVNCEAKYTKYPEYAILKVAHKGEWPEVLARGAAEVQQAPAEAPQLLTWTPSFLLCSAASVPSHCAKNVQKIYFDWSLPFSPCVSCK